MIYPNQTHNDRIKSLIGNVVAFDFADSLKIALTKLLSTKNGNQQTRKQTKIIKKKKSIRKHINASVYDDDDNDENHEHNCPLTNVILFMHINVIS